jgi:hypothetical protein
MLKPAGLTVSDNAAVAVRAAVSVTFTVKFDVPAADGVPLMLPPGERLKPAGKVPADTVHVYGMVPPLAFRACEYTLPAVAGGKDDVVTANGGGATVIDKAEVSVLDPPSVTFTVKLEVPNAVGVPDIVPPAERVSPAGKVPAETVQLNGGVPPAALKVCEYGVPSVACGSGPALMETAAGLTVMVRPAVAVLDPLSVTFTKKLDEPAAAGVPDIVPAADKVRPAGNAPAAMLHVYGVVPPVALSPAE